jgi:hypothetical protein
MTVMVVKWRSNSGVHSGNIQRQNMAAAEDRLHVREHVLVYNESTRMNDRTVVVGTGSLPKGGGKPPSPSDWLHLRAQAGVQAEGQPRSLPCESCGLHSQGRTKMNGVSGLANWGHLREK